MTKYKTTDELFNDFMIEALSVQPAALPASAAQQLTIKTIMSAPPNWLVFHHSENDGKVSPWYWAPIMFVAHVVDADGVEAIVPMIEGEWGLVLPADNMTVCMCHAAAASTWLDEGENLVEADGLAKYLEKVQP